MRSLRRLMLVSFVLLVAFSILPGIAGAAESVRIKGVSFVDATHGYVVGTRLSAPGGFVSFTQDGGTTWRHKGFSLSIEGVDAQDASTASVVQFYGSTVLSTNNSGVSWDPSGPFGESGLNMRDIARLPSGTLVVVGQHVGAAEGDLATIWRSTDGGSTWSKRFDGPIDPSPEAPSTLASLVAVKFAADGQFGWAVGTELVQGSESQVFKQVLLYKTADAGSTWTTQTVPGATQPATSLSVVNGTTAWLACTNGAVFRTSDGSTWVPTTNTNVASILGGRTSIDAVSDLTAVVVGQLGQTSRTTDGGVSWSPSLVRPTLQHLWSVDMVDASVGYAGGNDVLLKTTDGGASWKPVTYSFALVPTTLTGTSGTRTTAYSGSIAIYADLRTGSNPLSNMPVVLEYSSNGSTGWTRATATVTHPISGRYQTSVKRTTALYYRFRFLGDSTYSPATGPVVKVYPKVYLTNPVAPTTVYHNRAFTTYGYLKPKHTAGSYPVRIYKYRYVSGVWKSYGYITAKASNYSTYTKYVRAFSLPYAGKWRLRTYHAADGANAATWSSGYDYVTVR